LVVTGGKSAPLVGEVEVPLDDVATLVGGRVQAGRPPTERALALAGGDLVLLLRDHRLDPPSSEHPARHTRGVRAVGNDRVGPGARTSGTQPWNTDVGQHAGEHRPVVTLPTRDDRGQRPPEPIDSGMDLGRQTAAGTSDAVTGRLTLSAEWAVDEPLGRRRVIRRRPLCPD